MTQPTHAELLDRWHRDSARRAVRRAIKAGKIVAPKRCEGCGHEVPLQAHHRSGYTDTAVLDVAFYCRACHDDVHRGTLVDPPHLLLAIRARERWPHAFDWIDRIMDGKPSGLGDLTDEDQREIDRVSGS